MGVVRGEEHPALDGPKLILLPFSKAGAHPGEHVGEEGGIRPPVGQVVASEMFYDDDCDWKLWAKYGVLGVEMEAAELYTLAAQFRRKALAILTVSDHMATGESCSAEERQNSFRNMMEIALEAAVSV